MTWLEGALRARRGPPPGDRARDTPPVDRAAEQVPKGGIAVVAVRHGAVRPLRFEGPDFLGDLYAQLPQFASLRASTAGAHLDAHAPLSGLRLAEGSWGANGDFSMWNGPFVEWTWPIIWRIEDRFWSLASRAIADPRTHEILAQAARAMLLLQSSDWQFIISREVEDCRSPVQRARRDCRNLLTRSTTYSAEATISDSPDTRAQKRDDVFRRSSVNQGAIGDRDQRPNVAAMPVADR
jgi:hypothetical protein